LQPLRRGNLLTNSPGYASFHRSDIDPGPFDVLADISAALAMESATPGGAGLISGAQPPLQCGFVVP
jgi:hypothetical protein